ncbi:MAG TPA: deoxyribose-phosphate aldolase [Phycisphaerae bacterium]|nr:deoxyribose-phosphate aldolase [Phycisphaerae bacterium]HNU47004.1 deoxyribose-phosphate aldolase [Phycisphaerae bacterium]
MSDLSDIARMIDHTLLKPEALPEQIDALCDEAVEHGFAAVCVHPVYVWQAARRLGGRGRLHEPAPVVATVVGFPLGANLAQTKVAEARQALKDGAREIDMVVHLGALISGEESAVVHEIAAVAELVRQPEPPGILKVILETAALTEEQIVRGCQWARLGGADFVKTSTGFHPAGGATIAHVRLLREAATPLRVKASGGIRDLATARAMVEAGATRLGTSSGVAIARQLRGAAPGADS